MLVLTSRVLRNTFNNKSRNHSLIKPLQLSGFHSKKSILHSQLKTQFDLSNKAHFKSYGPILKNLILPPRQLIDECLILPDNLACRVELLGQFDINLISRFGLKFIQSAEPLSASLSCSPDDLKMFYYDKCKRSIDSKMSIIAFKTQNLSNNYPTTISPELKSEKYLTSSQFPIAVVLISTLTITKAHRAYPKVFKYNHDYGKSIDNGEYLSRNANRVHVLVRQLQREFPFFVTPDVKKIGTIESYCIHPSYERTGLSLTLIKKALILAKSNGVEYVSMLSLTEQQRKICSLLHFKPCLDFSLEKFCDNSNIVFNPITNDSTSDKLTLMIAKL